MTPLCCNDANVDHCSKNFFYATPTCRNDFWQSVAEIVVIYIQGTFCSVSRRESRCNLRRSLINNKNTREKSRIICNIPCVSFIPVESGQLVANKRGHS